MNLQPRLGFAYLLDIHGTYMTDDAHFKKIGERRVLKQCRQKRKSGHQLDKRFNLPGQIHCLSLHSLPLENICSKEILLITNEAFCWFGSHSELVRQ